MKINCKPENLLIAGLYTPPNYSDHAYALRHFSTAMEHLRERFSSFSLLAFTDFNRDFRKLQHTRNFENLGKLGFRVHMDNTVNSFTREQKVANRLSRSYLDYFLSCNLHVGQLSLGHRMGGSDHRLVVIEVSRTKPVVALNKSRINYKRLREGTSDVADCIRQMRTETPASILHSFTDLLETQKQRCPTFFSKPKSLVKTFDLVEAELSKEDPDNHKVEKMLRACIRTDFNTFLDHIQRLRMEGEMKEYYLKIGFLFKRQGRNPFINEL